MLIHDLIKIKYAQSGYLPNYPYHLISDEEMCDAFISNVKFDIASSDSNDKYAIIKSGEGYFFDTYPLLDNSMAREYANLVIAIVYQLNELKSSNDEDYELPNWIYSYMLGEVISVDSDSKDIHDLIYLMGVDNKSDEFIAESSLSCLETSKKCVKRLSDTTTLQTTINEENITFSSRPPTMFGEPHVIKYLRLQEADPIY
jgi:hypothetical protein